MKVAGQVSEPDLRCKMKSQDKVHLSLKAARRKKAELMGYDLILLGRLAESWAKKCVNNIAAAAAAHSYGETSDEKWGQMCSDVSLAVGQKCTKIWMIDS